MEPEWEIKAGRQLVREVLDYAIYEVDPAGCILSWNKGAELITGYHDGEILGKHISILFTPEARAEGLPDRMLREAAERGRFEARHWVVRHDGTRCRVQEAITALHDAAGDVPGFLKIARDLSTEDALRESEARYRSVIEGVRDYAIFTMDPQRRVTSWNTAARQVLGFDEQEMIGRSADLIFTPEDRAAGAPQHEAQQAADTGRAANERWHVRRDGSWFWGSGLMTAKRDEQGQVVGFFKVLRDYTERKQMQDKMARLLRQEQAAREEAEEATRLKDEFLAVVSHELRTPLAAILLWVKLLRAGALKPDGGLEAAEVIEKSAKAQQALIEDLLDVSRILSGKMRLTLRPTDLTALTGAAIEAVRPSADAKAITLQADIDPALGLAQVDPDRVQQVLWNLLTNAVKFTPPGGRIAVEMRRLPRQVYMRVSDTGKGISAAFLPHVFDRFRQADASTTRSEGGLGLGLSITRQLVELHGGTIEAQSEGEGRGATFIVHLPLRVATGTAPGRPPPQVDAVFTPSDALVDTWVLLVEDDDATRRNVTWILEQSGAEVTALPSADEALAALAADGSGRRPDVLISDTAVPAGDGIQLLRRLRELEARRGEPALPAIAWSAGLREDDRERMRDAGFQEFLEKSADPDWIIQTVVRLSGRMRG